MKAMNLIKGQTSEQTVNHNKIFFWQLEETNCKKTNLHIIEFNIYKNLLMGKCHMKGHRTIT